MVFCLLSFKILQANVVTVEKAYETAISIFGKNSRSSNHELRYICNSSDLLTPDSNSRSQTTPTFYIFGETNGFIIISAEDRVKPILAYSFFDKAPQPDNLPESLIDWFTNISNQIETIRSQEPSSSIAKSEWTNIQIGNTVIELETAKWNQHKPYNDQCPMDGNERSITGCTATATAIVMKYHNWPQYGSGVTDSYTTDSKSIYVESRNLNHEYDWKNMPLVYTNNGYNSEQAYAVSTLMADIGAAFQADYSAETTSSRFSTEKLYENFGYSPSMKYLARNNYADDTWLAMLKSEIDALRPILYCGSGNSAHIFVLDGYSEDNFFHINWGWGGFCNGYYTLSNLNPDDGYVYNENQWACFNLKPNNSNQIEDWITFRNPGIEIFQTSFESNETYYFDKLVFTNNTAVDFAGSFRGAVTDRNGKIREWITTELKYTLPHGYYVSYSNIRFSIKSDIQIGDRIRFFYKKDDAEDWSLIKSFEDGCYWEILIADEFYISESTSFTFDKTNSTIQLETKDGVNATLYNSSNIEIDAGISRTGNIIIIDLKQLTSDEYTIKLEKKDDLKLLNFSVKPL